MVALVLLLAVLVLALIVGRVFTAALTATGMTRESARFQARSALTGAGFTTVESESIVNHPVRRRIVMQAMLLGQLGLISTAGSFIVAFANDAGLLRSTLKAVVLVAGLLAILAASRSRWVDRRLTGIVSRIAARVTDLDVRDYQGMLRLSGDYAVGELPVEAGDWLAGKTLADAALPNEGILVLGIIRENGDYIGAPTGRTVLEPGDDLMLYGRQPVFAELDERRAGVEGDRAHRAAIAEQARVIEEQRRADSAQRTAEEAGSAEPPTPVEDEPTQGPGRDA